MVGVKVILQVESEISEKDPLQSMDETIGPQRCGMNAIGMEGSEKHSWSTSFICNGVFFPHEYFVLPERICQREGSIFFPLRQISPRHLLLYKQFTQQRLYKGIGIAMDNNNIPKKFILFLCRFLMSVLEHKIPKITHDERQTRMVRMDTRRAFSEKILSLTFICG